MSCKPQGQAVPILNTNLWLQMHPNRVATAQKPKLLQWQDLFIPLNIAAWLLWRLNFSCFSELHKADCKPGRLWLSIPFRGGMCFMWYVSFTAWLSDFVCDVQTTPIPVAEPFIQIVYYIAIYCDLLPDRSQQNICKRIVNSMQILVKSSRLVAGSWLLFSVKQTNIDMIVRSCFTEDAAELSLVSDVRFFRAARSQSLKWVQEALESKDNGPQLRAKAVKALSEWAQVDHNLLARPQIAACFQKALSVSFQHFIIVKGFV